jgi:hypothetical protein
MHGVELPGKRNALGYPGWACDAVHRQRVNPVTEPQLTVVGGRESAAIQ